MCFMASLYTKETFKYSVLQELCTNLINLNHHIDKSKNHDTLGDVLACQCMDMDNIVHYVDKNRKA